jgi:hypothetical protein
MFFYYYYYYYNIIIIIINIIISKIYTCKETQEEYDTEYSTYNISIQAIQRSIILHMVCIHSLRDHNF